MSENDVKLTVRLPQVLHTQLVELARKQSRSLNQQIIYSIDETIKSNGQESALVTRLATIEETVAGMSRILDALRETFQQLLHRKSPNEVKQEEPV